MIIKRWSFLFIWIFLVLAFFSPIILGKVPSPLDTIVGLYHPWRDQIWDNFVNGVPYKNFLITDPVRQQIPWRYLSIEEFKKGNIFGWNPYSFSGTPLTANVQTALFYPLNILFLFLPFINAWSINIILSPFLAGIFIYSYLRFFKLKMASSFLGALAFSFSGFFIAWLEWGTVTNVLLWLPLILLSKEKILNKLTFKWLFILGFAETSQLLAGHLQISFYVLIFSSFYLLVRIIQLSYRKDYILFLKDFWRKMAPFLVLALILLPFVLIQYYPFFNFLKLTARNFDLPEWQTSSWFLPLQHIVQFLVPDFFGNPTTLNYWGEWNYGEFVGYIGVIPLIFSLFALFFRRDKKTLFYSLSFFIILVLLLRNPLSETPFTLGIPFLSTAQPTRLISILVFSLSVLSALGFDLFLKNKSKNVIIISSVLFLSLCILWLVVLFSKNVFPKELANNLLIITKRNLVIPTLLVSLSLLFLFAYSRTKKQLFIFLILLLTVCDLFRFGRKFVSFSNQNWFYPLTKTISFLQSQKEPFRFMAVDRRLFPPNFSIMYKLEDVSGYDPLYLLSYAKMVQAWNSNEPDIKPGRFNRIITPQNYDSFIADLLNVRYILSLTELDSPKLILRFSENETKVYENLSAFPRLFFVEQIRVAKSEDEEIKLMYEEKNSLLKVATVKEAVSFDTGIIDNNERADFIEREENVLRIKTVTNKNRFLVLSEINYPSWKVYVDGKRSKVITADLILRGVVVPQGEHIIEFKYEEV